jgi:protein SCO1/2
MAVLAAALLIMLPGLPREALAGDDLSELAFQPHPGAHLPLGLALVDEQGRTAPLGHFFTGKPVLLVLQYLRCTRPRRNISRPIAVPARLRAGIS